MNKEGTREIKFRGWRHGQMVYGCSNLCIGTDGTQYWQFAYDVQIIGKEERFIIQQFTGLKDKNGKEIYEGDICSSGDGGLFQAEFKFAAWHFIAAPNSKFIAYPAAYSNASRLEVIGNICENPELLKEAA